MGMTVVPMRMCVCVILNMIVVIALTTAVIVVIMVMVMRMTLVRGRMGLWAVMFHALVDPSIGRTSAGAKVSEITPAPKAPPPIT